MRGGALNAEARTGGSRVLHLLLCQASMCQGGDMWQGNDTWPHQWVTHVMF
jgi:hypothetical protein